MMIDVHEITLLVPAVVAGVLLGAIYFGGLWWSVNHMASTRHPLKSYFATLLIRLAVLLAVFYGVLAWFGWPHLLAMLAGLVVSRMLLIRFVGRIPEAQWAQQKPAG